MTASCMMMKSLMPRSLSLGLLLTSLMALSGAAQADAVQRLRDFAREVKSAQADFTQTVTSADGARKKVSTGQFSFSRPNRFRFAYAKPAEQLIVADGVKVWIYDADLNQASSRSLDKALGSTPVALLAGGDWERDFTLQDDGVREGIEWVRATPKAKDASFREVRVGFKGAALAAVEITDNFGQRSLLAFSRYDTQAKLSAEVFQFKPPAGADVVEQ
jgi:outer membrane lipoprotein carrier protein